MNPIIKKILLEMMSYSNTRKFTEEDIYIKRAFEKLGSDIIITRAKNILLSFLGPRRKYIYSNLEKLEIHEKHMSYDTFKEVYEEYKLLFEHLPEVKEIYALKEKHIEFNPSLSKNDILNLYQFVEENYVINPNHMSRYIKPQRN
ncbi:hypothetical protein [Tenacibaculum maritimum]|uniref:hypothetical protein n=3 Tax=Tenacibaculum maritimum TaxID=107401 RepID=UPI0003FCA976|nr:hypothetical protein [Tenacibaculum maritimum]MCD9563109.1 hypothetical protein [Tenacibaculum maritimum]MCD9567041.1 hypothetical protein [Tenacibaculum maritimum]MCD9580051.1 hypothetical protein [Tenacibaculum maritimum]MCD9586225.1 hypothetical protein [Tenacibaculum maritimum]MCD9597295.1 hypothetical protein [Tenacibaculum maritimum]